MFMCVSREQEESAQDKKRTDYLVYMARQDKEYMIQTILYYSFKIHSTISDITKKERIVEELDFLTIVLSQ